MTNAQNYDVVIVGAGVAGLSAVLQLLDQAKQKGLSKPSVLIVEADTDAGGRVKDAYLSNGVQINAGAHWGHGGENNEFFSWAQSRYDLGESSIDGADRRIYAGHEKSYDQAFRARAISQIDQLWEDWDREHPGEDISLAGLLKRTDQKEAKVFGNYMARMWMAVDSPEQVSMRDYALDPNGPGGVVLKGGNGQIIRAMLDELNSAGVEILTNTPVSSLRHKPDGLVVVTDTNANSYNAKQVVVTASAGVLKSNIIQMDQFVQDTVMPYLDDVSMATMNKIVVPVNPSFFEKNNIQQDTFINVLDDDMVALCHANTGGKPTLTVFVSGADAKAVESMSEEPLRTKAFSVLDRVPELQGYQQHINGNILTTKWASNPYTAGSYSGTVPSGVRSDPVTAGQVTFAGEMFCADPNKSPSQLVGAWHSGRMAAERLLPSLALTPDNQKLEGAENGNPISPRKHRHLSNGMQ